MSFDFTQSHFALFGLQAGFTLDRAALDAAYRALQTEYHPDRFAAASDAQKRLSLQIATQINQGYQTLKNPLSRARYLLQLHGVDTQEETNTAMPVEFLMQQMEWRETIADAKTQRNGDTLEALSSELAGEHRTLVNELAVLLDEQQDWPAAAEAVRKLRFLDKLSEEVDNAIDAVTF
ncbi:molecular chaperone HscB [Andreprevotia lacus DSM 23236]|jgi:molecular chaperone HscB|uniref:Co-chaperone protein HscB homolog n=1 Tax=Andreprevotia lacus DSM 23236 TaxID=1121001 RepID=A0A1W1X7Q5_9NEIS|nr:Fe-S protein assembly co-chaperone HscB [Andreprevotia lacus]SMC19880.1 molecular chaperone HscB [Andreprevotia lacus DSM 23236]